MRSANRFHGISARFDKPLSFTNRPLVIQYYVKPDTEISCSGAYLKLIGSPDFSPPALRHGDRYVIMFGPDKCGETNRIHFIFQHENPLNRTFEEKHLVDPPTSALFQNGTLYELRVGADNPFRIAANGRSVYFGNLLSDFKPPVNPPREIDDPGDPKPADWVDAEYVPEPDATPPAGGGEPEYIADPTKVDAPAGWLRSEPRMIPDPGATPPPGYDADVMGDWEPPLVPNPICQDPPGCGPYEPPLVPNPNYAGPWEPPMMRNPMYRGEWRPRRIANPGFFEDLHPHNFPPFTGIAFDLWTVDGGVGFADLIISDDPAAVERYNKAQSGQRENVGVEPTADGRPAGNAQETTERKMVETITIIVTGMLLLGPVGMCLCMRRGKRESSSA
jgi:calnexin